MKLVNLVATLLLRSPLHRVLSGRYAIIEFTGRTSGRRYATPVAYHSADDRILISTDSRWWRNFATSSPVRLRLRGRDIAALARATDAAESARIVRTLVDAIPSYRRPAQLAVDAHGRVPDAEIERAVAAGRVGIVATLTTVG